MRTIAQFRSFNGSVRLLVINQFGINLGFYMLMPYLANHLAGGLSMAAWTVGLVLGVRTPSQQGLFLLGGTLADRLGYKPMIISGCALRAAGFGLLGVVDTHRLGQTTLEPRQVGRPRPGPDERLVPAPDPHRTPGLRWWCAGHGGTGGAGAGAARDDPADPGQPGHRAGVGSGAGRRWCGLSWPPPAPPEQVPWLCSSGAACCPPPPQLPTGLSPRLLMRRTIQPDDQ